MMVALLLYGYCQGERPGRVAGQRCVRDVGYRVIAGGLRPDHATIARFRARHEKALGELFSQVLRLLAAEGMVWPKTPAGHASALPSGPDTPAGSRPPPAPGGACTIPAAGRTTGCGPAPWNQCPGNSRPARN